MASVINSFKEVFSDKFSFIKLVILAIPVYDSYQIYLQSKQDYTTFFWVAGLTVFFLTGFLITLTSNVINERDRILPSLNPLKLGFVAIKGIIALAPIILGASFVANYVCSFINTIPGFDIIFKSLIWLVAGSLILTSFIMFSQRENILDAYKFKIFFLKAGDLITSMLTFLLQLAIVNAVVGGFIGYLLFILFDYGPVLDSFIIYAIIFNLAVTAHYIGETNYDIVVYGSKKD